MDTVVYNELAARKSILAAICFDKHLNITFMNATAQSLLGYTDETVAGMRIDDLIPSVQHDELGFPDRFVDENLREFLYGRKQDGSEVLMTVEVMILPEVANDAARKRSTFQNAKSDNVEYCLQFELNDDLLLPWYRLTVLGSKAAIITITPNGRIVTFNKAACELFEWSESEASGKNVNMLMPEPFHSQHDSYLANYQRTGNAKVLGRDLEVFAVTKSGHKFPGLLAVTKFEVGRKMYFVGVLRDDSEKRQQMLKLDQERELLSAVVDGVPDSMITIDDFGTILTTNQAFDAQFGFDHGELVGSNVKGIMPQPYRDEHDMYLKNYRDNGVRNIIDVPQELGAVAKNGDPFPIRLFVSEVIVGGTVQFVGLMKNISQERAKAEALRKTQSLMKGFLDNALDGIITITMNGSMEAVNPAIEKLFGYSQGELLGRNIKMLMPNPYSAEHDSYLESYRVSGIRKVIGIGKEVSGRRKNGSIFPLELGVSETIVGSMHFFTGVMRDVTDKKSEQRTLQEMEQRSRGTINGMTDGVITIDQSGTITDFNLAATNMFGISEEDAVGGRINMVMPEPHRSAHDTYLERYRQTGVKNVIGRKNQLKALRANGDEFHVNLTVTEGMLRSNRVYIGLVRDVSEEVFRQDKLTAILDAVPDGIISIELSGLITNVNKACCSMFKRDRETLIGRNVKLLMPEPYCLEHDQYLSRYAETGEKKVIGVRQTLSAVTSEGSIFPVSLTVTETALGDRKLFTGIVKDITLDRQRDEEMSRSKTKMEAVLSMAQDAIISISETCMIESANPAAEQIFGYTLSQMVGQNINMLMPPPYKALHDGYVNNYRRTGVKKVLGVPNVSVMAKRRNGEVFNVELTVFEIDVLSSRMFTGMVRDVTERKKQEEELALSQKRTTAILDSMTDAMFTIDETGSIIEANTIAYQVFKYPMQSLTGKNIASLMPDPHRSNHHVYIQNYIRTGVKKVIGKFITVNAMRSGGEEFPIRLIVTEAMLNSKLIFLGVARDLSEAIAKQERLESVMNAVPDGIITINQEGNIISANRSSLEMFEHKTLVNQNINTLMPEPYSSEHFMYLERYVNSGEPRILNAAQTLSGLRSNGKIFPISLVVTEAFVGDKKIFTGNIKDVTESKERDEQLIKSQSKMEALLAMAPDAIISIDENGIVESINPAGEQIFGYPAGQLIGHNINILIPPPHSAKHDSYLRNYMNTGIRKVIGNPRMELLGKRRNGEIFNLELTVNEIVVGSTKVFTGTCRDISKRKAEEAALQVSEHRTNMIINSMMEGVVAIDEFGMITLFNQAATRIFNRTSEETLGENVKCLMPEPYATHHDTYLSNYRETGVAHIIEKTTELTARRYPDAHVPVKVTIRESSMNGARVFIGVVVDIMETQAEEKRLRNTFDAIPDGIICIDITGKINSVNLGVLNMIGYTEEEMMEMNIRDMMPEPYRSEHDSYLNNYRTTGVAKILGRQQQLSAMRKNGEVFPINLVVSETYVSGNLFFSGFMRDATAEQAEQVQVQYADMRIRSIVTSAADGIIMADEYGFIDSVNPAGAQMFGHDDKDMIGQSVGILCPAPHNKLHSEYIENFKQTGVSARINALSVVTAMRSNGDTFSAEIYITELVVGSSKLYAASVRDITERVKSEEIVRNAEARVTAIIEAIGDPVITINRDGNVISFNKAAEETFGYQKDQIINRNVNMIIPEPFSSNHNQYIAKFLKSGVKRAIGKELTVSGLRSDKSTFPVSLFVNNISVGKEVFFVGVAQDISEKVRKQERLDAVIEAIADGIITIDSDNKIVAVNSATELMFGYKRDKLVGEAVMMLMPEPYATEHPSYLENYFRSGVAKIIGEPQKLSAVRSDGTVFPINLTVSEAKIGNSVLFTGLVGDLTERYNQEDQLNKHKSMIEAILGVTEDAILTTDDYGIIESANEGCLEMFGLRLSEVIGRNVSTMMPPPYNVEHDKYLLNYRQRGVRKMVGQRGVEVIGRRKNGDVFPIRLTVSEFIIDSSRHFTATISDMTELKGLHLEENAARLTLESMFEVSTDAIVVVTGRSSISYVNQAALAMFGYASRDMMVGSNLNMLIPPDVVEQHTDAVRAFVRDPRRPLKPHASSLKILKADSSEVSVSLTLTCVEIAGSTVFTAVLRNLAESLSQSEESMRTQKKVAAVFDSLQDGLIVIDPKGKIRIINTAAAYLFRISPSEMMGKNVSMLMTEPLRSQHQKHIDAAVARPAEQNTRLLNGFKLRGTGLRGDLTSVEVDVTVTEVSVGPSRLFTGIVRDVSDKALMESNVTTYKNKLEDIVVEASHPELESTDMGIIKSFNKAAEKLFGWKGDEIMGSNIELLLPPQLRDLHKQYLKRYPFKDSSDIIGVYRQVNAVKRDSTQFAVNLLVKRVDTEKGYSFHATFKDASEIARLSLSARICQQQSLLLAKVAPDAVIIIDQHGTMVHFNPAAEKLFGYVAEVTLRQNVSILMPTNIARHHNKYLQRYCSTGQRRILGTWLETTCRRMDGSSFPARIYVVESTVNQERIFTGVIKDCRRGDGFMQMSRNNDEDLMDGSDYEDHFDGMGIDGNERPDSNDGSTSENSSVFGLNANTHEDPSEGTIGNVMNGGLGNGNGRGVNEMDLGTPMYSNRSDDDGPPMHGQGPPLRTGNVAVGSRNPR